MPCARHHQSVPCTVMASWCSGSTSDSKSDNGGSIPSEVTFSRSASTSPMAQSVARQAVNLQVAGSNPAGGGVCAASAVVQWLGYLAFTQETRVQTPVAEDLQPGMRFAR